MGDASVGAGVDCELLAAVVSAIRDALSGDPLGLYVFGSATLGRLRPTSDLDLLALLERPATRMQKEALARGLLSISGRRLGEERGRPVELTCVVRTEVQPWRYPPIMDFQYGDWLRSDFESDEESVWQPSPNADLAVLVAMTRISGRPVIGPPAEELFDPIPATDVERSIIDSLAALRSELDSDTRNVILTLARGWMTVVTGEIRSKEAAATWALGQLPPQHQLPLARACDLYVTGGREDWREITHTRIAAYADYVVSEIKAVGRTRRGLR